MLLKCHAACETSDIIAAAGIDWDEVCEHRDDHRAEGNVDTSGPASHVQFRTLDERTGCSRRCASPLPRWKFSQRHASPSEKSGWYEPHRGSAVPYRLFQIIRVADGQTIVTGRGDRRRPPPRMATQRPAARWAPGSGRPPMASSRKARGHHRRGCR